MLAVNGEFAFTKISFENRYCKESTLARSPHLSHQIQEKAEATPNSWNVYMAAPQWNSVSKLLGRVTTCSRVEAFWGRTDVGVRCDSRIVSKHRV